MATTHICTSPTACAKLAARADHPLVARAYYQSRRKLLMILFGDGLIKCASTNAGLYFVLPPLWLMSSREYLTVNGFVGPRRSSPVLPTSKDASLSKCATLRIMPLPHPVLEGIEQSFQEVVLPRHVPRQMSTRLPEIRLHPRNQPELVLVRVEHLTTALTSAPH